MKKGQIIIFSEQYFSWFAPRLELICSKKLASAVNFFLVTCVNLTFLPFTVCMKSSLFKSKNGRKSLVQIMQNQCELLSFCKSLQVCFLTFALQVCNRFYRENQQPYFEGRGNGGYSSRQTNYMRSKKCVLSVPFVFGYQQCGGAFVTS